MEYRFNFHHTIVTMQFSMHVLITPNITIALVSYDLSYFINNFINKQLNKVACTRFCFNNFHYDSHEGRRVIYTTKKWGVNVPALLIHYCPSLARPSVTIARPSVTSPPVRHYPVRPSLARPSAPRSDERRVRGRGG